MSKRCPDCGFINEDSKIYCGSCGELLDSELRLIKELNDQASGPRKSTSKTSPSRSEPAPSRKNNDEDYTAPKLAQKEKKSSAAPWIILGLIVVAAIAWFFLH